MTIDIEHFDDVICRDTACARCEREACCTRPEKQVGDALESDFSLEHVDFTEQEAISEARRCLYCSEPKCTSSCPARVNTKAFLHAALERNFYEAARLILSTNPLGLSTSRLCACEEEGCRGGCILNGRAEGSIRIEKVQNYVMRAFREMRIAPICMNEPTGKKVAVVGAGPAGITAATFLARLGHSVDVIDRETFAGGVLMTEIPSYRMPADEVQFEVDLLRAMPNVTLKLGQNVESYEALRSEYDAVFVGTGKVDAAFELENSVSSHTFLKAVNLDQKIRPLFGDDAEIFGHEYSLPELKGKHAVVLGSGDTALDCAGTLYRLGCDSVTLAFRKDIRGVRAVRNRLFDAINDGVEMQPLVQPVEVITDDEGKVTGVRCERQRRSGKVYSATGKFVEIPCDFVVSAFGSKMDAATEEVAKNFDNKSMRVISAAGDMCPVYIGGDSANSTSVVEAVNDGRTAATRIHEAMTGEELEKLPPFTTEVEKVDISTVVDGVKYENPFGLASAPCSGTYEILRRAFIAGAGFVVTKTFSLAKDTKPNNCIRIVSAAPESNIRFATSAANQVLISEHEPEYWADTISKLKAEFPSRIVIASIMASGNLDDWKALSSLAEKAGADAVECNLSCPNYSTAGNTGNFKMAMALGQDPESIKKICAAIKAEVDIPFYVKCTPNVAHIEQLAAAAMEGGATGVSMINTVNGVARVTASGFPISQTGKDRRTISGGLSGDQVRPIAIRNLATTWNAVPEAQHHILGIGGARSALTALELIYAGGSIVQVCSAIQRYSAEIFQEMISGLKFVLYAWSRPDLRAYLNSRGMQRTMPYGDLHEDFLAAASEADREVPSVKDLVGKAANHIGGRNQMEHPEDWRAVSSIMEDKCIGCLTCVTTCRDNATSAISKGPNGRAVVDLGRCVGCALCTSVCDFGAIKMVEAKPLKDMTEEEKAALPTNF